MTRIADSSFLIALFDAEDPRRADATAEMEDPEPIEIPSEVLSETLGVVHKRIGYATSARIWRNLIRFPHVTLVETTDIERIAAVFAAAKGRLSWVDAAVVAACKADGSKPLCYDEHIERAVRR